MTPSSSFPSLPSKIHDQTVQSLNLIFLGIISSIKLLQRDLPHNTGISIKHECFLTKFLKSAKPSRPAYNHRRTGTFESGGRGGGEPSCPKKLSNARMCECWNRNANVLKLREKQKRSQKLVILKACMLNDLERSADQQQRHLCFKVSRSMYHLDDHYRSYPMFETSFSTYSRRSKNNMRHC